MAFSFYRSVFGYFVPVQRQTPTFKIKRSTLSTWYLRGFLNTTYSNFFHLLIYAFAKSQELHNEASNSLKLILELLLTNSLSTEYFRILLKLPENTRKSDKQIAFCMV
uniref:Uncharacterized protein n=1 Tax=Lepeophtheirus salmonis TaxID=72036 RepID=A0A0K2TEE4_LEPSM